ncbi:hypothetical protein TIFTF001_001322, partial [Ficus carica]
MPKNLWYNTQCDCSKWDILAQLLCCCSPAKGEAPQSDWDTGGVSTTGTPMLKSVRRLMSVPHGFGCSGDPIGSAPKCSRRVNRLQAHKSYRSNGLVSRVPSSASHQTLGGGWNVVTGFKSGVKWWMAVRSSRIIPGFYPGQHRTNSMVVVPHSSWGSSTHVNKHSSRGSSTRINIGPTRWWSFGIVPGEL